MSYLYTSHANANTQDDLLLNNLMRFYENPQNISKIKTIVNGESKVSLRIIDWFVTSYAARHSSSFVLDGARVIVFHEYKAMLKSYSKAAFDPFCRRARIFVDTELGECVLGPAGGSVIETTNGQLNFFRWAISRGILVYAASILPHIDADLSSHTLAVKRGKLAEPRVRHGCACIGHATVTFE